MGEKLLGTVTHYFRKLSVAVLDLKEPLAVKDLVAFRGATTDFEQEIESLQVDHQNIEVAGMGQEVAVKVKDKVRAGDTIYKLNVD
ncbi:MAG: translation elongation factor-like protein [Bacillota bacterium]|nr:translation elongation factor-like protein [Bacillota bacterium]